MRFLTKRSNKENYPMMSLFDDFVDRFFDFDKSEKGLSSRMDIDFIENDDEYLMKANLPGVNKKNVKITTKNNMLVIEAHQEDSKEKKEKGKIVYSERYSGSFQRSFTLPEDADAEKIKASMKDGILEVSLPKSETKKSKEIVVE